MAAGTPRGQETGGTSDATLVVRKHKMKSEISFSISGKLLPDELGELLDLVDLPLATSYTPTELAQLIVGSTVYITARYSGNLVGFGRMLSDGAAIAYINDMAVHPQYQRQGIGQRILELLMEAVGDVSSIYLYTNTADSLYMRNGFQPSEKRLYVYRV
jgi:ribosomal protein S18 acetylase RimI-like enzyme